MGWKINEKSLKIGPKIDPKDVQKIDRFWDRFLIDFWTILGAKIDPKSEKKGFQDEVKKSMKKQRRRSF